jgi:LEA14-like dessication related protein
MNKPTIIGLSFLALLGLYFFNQQRDAGYLEYVVKRVDLNWAGASPIFTVSLGIQNPSNTTFTVESIAGTLYSNGDPLGNISAFDKIVIPPNDETVYPLNFRLSLIGVASDIIKIFTGGGTSQQIEFDGVVNANGIAVPLKFKYVIG